MKPGDLVTVSSSVQTRSEPVFGIVVEAGKYAGNMDIKIMWSDIGITTERSDMLEVVSGEK